MDSVHHHRYHDTKYPSYSFFGFQKAEGISADAFRFFGEDRVVNEERQKKGEGTLFSMMVSTAVVNPHASSLPMIVFGSSRLLPNLF